MIEEKVQSINYREHRIKYNYSRAVCANLESGYHQLVEILSSHEWDESIHHFKIIKQPQIIKKKNIFAELIMGWNLDTNFGKWNYLRCLGLTRHLLKDLGVGSIGAAVVISKLPQTAHAIGRAMFWLHTKSFHPDWAAQNRFIAAILAEGGYTSSEQALEAKRMGQCCGCHQGSHQSRYR